MFVGTYYPRLDEKGRLFLPAKFRDDLAEGLVMARGQERCLFVWSAAEFERFTGRLDGASYTDTSIRKFTRMLYSQAADDRPDKQGRVTIPPGLRQYAGLDRDCAVIGARDRVEIWDATAWQRYSEENEQSFAELSEAISPGV